MHTMLYFALFRDQLFMRLSEENTLQVSNPMFGKAMDEDEEIDDGETSSFSTYSATEVSRCIISLYSLSQLYYVHSPCLPVL